MDYMAHINTLEDLNNIPIDTKILIFGHKFSHDILNVKWPHSLHAIEFGYTYNLDISNVCWPNSIHIIEFGSLFDCEINNVHWPESLKTLIFGWHFNKSIYNVKWPINLINLLFYELFNQVININNLPLALRTLQVGTHFSQVNCEWPKTLTALKIDICNLYDFVWPDMLDILDICLSHNYDMHRIKWPLNLTTMFLNIFYDNFDINHVQWPSKLLVLKLGGQFNNDISDTQFPNINILIFGSAFNKDINTVMFPKLLHGITFGHSFNQDISKVIFHELYTVYDYTNRITINSCNFPRSLHKIIHYKRIYNDTYRTLCGFDRVKFIKNDINIAGYEPYIVYKREVGQFTKAAKNY
jgi:hypothetical protein